MSECSTSYLSQIRDKNPSRYPPRKLIYQRDWSLRQRMLHKAGITNQMIADQSGLTVGTVNRALTLSQFGKVGFAKVMAMRAGVLVLMREHGFDVDCKTVTWAEYDDKLLEAT